MTEQIVRTSVWFGTLPTDWDCVPLKREFELLAGATPDTDDLEAWVEDSSGVSWAAIGDMSQRSDVLSTVKRISHSAVTQLHMPMGGPGTVLFAMYASVGEVATLRIPATWNQALLGINSRGRSSNRFVMYVLMAWKDHALAETRSNTQANLNATQVGRMMMPRPSLATQNAIADYLDRETAQIDALIAKQQQLIAVLRERRIAIVWNLLSRACGAEDKLGRWTRIGNGSTPSRDRTDYWSGGAFPWLNSSVVNQEAVTQAEQFVTSLALDECHLPIVPGGSILVGLTGQGKTRGMATLLCADATINQHLAYISPIQEKWVSKYLLWLLHSKYPMLRALSDENGSTKGGLTCGDLKDLRVTRPALHHQNLAVTQIETSVRDLDQLIEQTARFIEVAQERRSALITAAVTGQIDIRSAA